MKENMSKKGIWNHNCWALFPTVPHKKIKHNFYSTTMHPHNNYQELVYLTFHSLPFIPSITRAPFNKNYLRNISLIPPLQKLVKGTTKNNLTPLSSQHNLSKTKPHNSSTPLTYNKQTFTHINTSIFISFVTIFF
jgi:hypothetical protein